MRVYLAACLALLVVGVGGYFAVNAVQQPSGAAYSTDAARIDPSWSWRDTSTTTPPRPCEPRKLWQWFFVDFRDPAGESGLCSDSQ